MDNMDQQPKPVSLDPVVATGDDAVKQDAPLEKAPGLSPEEMQALGDTPLASGLERDPVDFDVQQTLRQHKTELLRIGSALNEIAGTNPGEAFTNAISARVGELETILQNRFGFKIRKR